MRLNRKQLASLWSGLVVFALVGLFPPWITHVQLKESAFRWPSRYAFIGAPVVEGLGAEIDVQRLVIGWAIVLAITAALMLSFRDKR